MIALLAVLAEVSPMLFRGWNPVCLSDFEERSCRLSPNGCVSLQSCGGDEANALSTRAWLAAAHHRLAGLLPKSQAGSPWTGHMVSAAEIG